MRIDQRLRQLNSTSSEGVTEFPLGKDTAETVSGQDRDTVYAHSTSGNDRPAIVSISDIHGYLEAARSALLTLNDHPEYEPVVTQNEEGNLQWAGNDYVLVFNGDLVDRGPANVETVQMAARLIEQAPTGRVRVTLGNHEMGVLTPDLFRWGGWYSGQVGDAGRRSLASVIRNGHIVAAYQGYNVIYAHAGQNDQYDVHSVNDDLAEAAGHLAGHIGGTEDATRQQQIVDNNPLVFGMGSGHPKGPDAGLIWLDFRHIGEDAPPQVVGHTRHDRVAQTGSVICENVIRKTLDSPGGEAVLVEDQDELVSLRRDQSGDVQQYSWTID